MLTQKVIGLKETNAVIQLVWKLRIENVDWYLLEKKQLQLTKSLEIKNKSSSGSSIIEWSDWNLFWVKASLISEELFQKFLANSKFEFDMAELVNQDDIFSSKEQDLISSNDIAKEWLLGVYEDL